VFQEEKTQRSVDDQGRMHIPRSIERSAASTDRSDVGLT
jgi:hypothetical protein